MRGEIGLVNFAVQTAMKAAADNSYRTCTFGAGATANPVTGHNSGDAKSAVLNSLYQTLTAKFRLGQKTGYRRSLRCAMPCLCIPHDSQSSATTSYVNQSIFPDEDPGNAILPFLHKNHRALAYKEEWQERLTTSNDIHGGKRINSVNSNN